jgi:hypothetical protein
MDTAKAKLCALIAATVAALIALTETDRLIAGAVGAGGTSRSLADVVGPSALSESARGSWIMWRHLPTEALQNQVMLWILVYVFFDLVFVVGYTWVGLIALGTQAHIARAFLLALAGFDVVEDMFTAAAAIVLHWSDVPGWLGSLIAWCAMGKWLALCLLLVAAFGETRSRVRILHFCRRVFRAVWEQRLSLIVVLILASLSLMPLPDVWDQLPDVQRGWVDNGPWPIVWAVVTTLAVTFTLLVMGRRRTARAHETYKEKTVPAEQAAYSWWLTGPAIIGLVVVALAFTGHRSLVDGQVVAFAVGIPVTLVAVSWAIRPNRTETPRQWLGWPAGLFAVGVAVFALGGFRFGQTTLWASVVVAVVAAGLVVVALVRSGPQDTLWAQLSPTTTHNRRADDVAVAGDVLAMAILVVAGLGLVRSFIAPWLLGLDLGWAIPFVLGGLVLTVGAPFVALALPGIGAASGGGKPVVAALALAILPLGSLLLAPLWTSTHLGVVATTLAGLGGWAVVLGLFIVRLQTRRPLEVFRLFHFEATPLLSLLALSLLVTNLAGGDADMHAIRANGPGLASDRVDLDTAFQDWLERSEACEQPVARGSDISVRPMLIVAASGGGMRSAVWTARAFDALRDVGPCGLNAVLLSSGVSGGSLGLVLARQGPASDNADRLANPEALSAAAAGVLVRDNLASLTGVRMPTVDSAGWRDRAGLMETSWEAAVPDLAKPYDVDVDGPTGALVLNSAAAGIHCRVIVSQIDLAGGTQPPSDCHQTTGLPAASLDFHDVTTVAGSAECPGPGLTWATAAMLSARFPTITPAGRVARCDHRQDLQLVDGGYAEASGVGTLAEIAPHLAQKIRTVNAAEDARSYIVPIVVYLEDETHAELEVPEPDLAPELLVPIAGLGAASTMNSSATWIQRATQALASPCPATSTSCALAVARIQDMVPGGAVVVAPVTKPSIDAPLGWTLSSASLERLHDAMDDQTRQCRSIRHYGCFQKLITILRPAPGT